MRIPFPKICIRHISLSVRLGTRIACLKQWVANILTYTLAVGSEVTSRWVPAHSGASGNEAADEYAKAAASGETPGEEVAEGYRDETSLSHVKS